MTYLPLDDEFQKPGQGEDAVDDMGEVGLLGEMRIVRPALHQDQVIPSLEHSRDRDLNVLGENFV